MKYFAVIVLSVAVCSAASNDFFTGQAARLVIGQRNFTAQDPGGSNVLLGGVGGVAVAGDMLFVTDANRVAASPLNHRVLMFRNISSQLPALTASIAPDTGRCPVCTGLADIVLGQPDFTKTELSLSAKGMRLPTAVATDGQVLAVADTDNNRVLIWRSIPTTNGQPADVVVGQEAFDKIKSAQIIDARSLRGPQGVWIQDGRLYVADTLSHRVLVWRSIPTQNNQAADIVLGQPDFTTFVQPDLTQAKVDAKPDNLLNPVSVTSDGRRLYVTDLGHNRVLIWNSIPNSNRAPADVVVGQPDMNSAVANNSYKTETDGARTKVMCDSNGTDSDGKATYPILCSSTLSFPRFALSDGRRLFIADGGNDRVLVYKEVPTQNGQAADVILGQIRGDLNLSSDNAYPLYRSSSDSLRTPLGLAWDGLNLYVTDPYNRRVMVFSVGEAGLPRTGVRNAASKEIYAVGGVTLSGSIKEGDEFTLKVGEKSYKYKIVKDDSFDNVVTQMVALVNAGEGDPNVFASPNLALGVIVLTSRIPGEAGNSIAYSVETSKDAQIVGTTAGATLSGGQDAAKIAPGTIVTIFGQDLAEVTISAPADATTLPRELGGVHVYFDGIRAPLQMVSPTAINAQVPWEVLDASSINAYVRIQRADGTISVKAAIGVPIIKQNPGIFAQDGTDPRPGVVMHYSSFATGTVSVDGTAKAGDTATVTVEDRAYTYTVKEGDTLASIRDGLIDLINQQDERVEAFAAGSFTRIRLKARVEGPAGNGLKYTAKAPEGAQVILTPTTPALCCANQAGALVTEDNPAVPGETIVVYATGLGLVQPDDALHALNTGQAYDGPDISEPNEFVSSLAGGKTANVLFAGMKKGTVGLSEVHLELNSDLPTNPRTQLTIAQDVYVSNIITFPLYNPTPSATETTP